MRQQSGPILLLAALALAACGRDTASLRTTSADGTAVSASADAAASRDRSLVRVVNAVSSGSDVSVRLGDRVLFPSVKPGTVSEYMELETDLAQFSVSTTGSGVTGTTGTMRNSDTTALRGSTGTTGAAATTGPTDATMLSQSDRILVDGNRYTVFVISKDVSSQQLRVVRDDVIADSGMARLRVIHAAPGAPEFDVKMVGASEQTFSGVNYLSEAGPVDLQPARSVNLEMRAAGEQQVLLRLPSFALDRGTATTIVVTGMGKLASFRYTDAAVAATVSSVPR